MPDANGELACELSCATYRSLFGNQRAGQNFWPACAWYAIRMTQETQEQHTQVSTMERIVGRKLNKTDRDK